MIYKQTLPEEGNPDYLIFWEKYLRNNDYKFPETPEISEKTKKLIRHMLAYD